MYGNLSVINNTDRVISVILDDAPLFSDILPGEHTKRKPVFAGTACVKISNSREKIVADILLSVPAGVHVILKIS